MKLKDNIVSFKWIRSNDKGIIMTDTFYNAGLRPTKMFIGEAIQVGQEVETIKPGDKFFVGEYDIKNFNNKWEEDKIYFIDHKDISMILLEDFNEEIRIIPSEEWNNLK